MQFCDSWKILLSKALPVIKSIIKFFNVFPLIFFSHFSQFSIGLRQSSQSVDHSKSLGVQFFKHKLCSCTLKDQTELTCVNIFFAYQCTWFWHPGRDWTQVAVTDFSQALKNIQDGLIFLVKIYIPFNLHGGGLEKGKLTFLWEVQGTFTCIQSKACKGIYGTKYLEKQFLKYFNSFIVIWHLKIS